MYRSPNSQQPNNEKLFEFLKTIGKSKEKYIVFGDFNFPNINWIEWSTTGDEKSDGFHFLEAVKDSFLTQIIDKPTRIVPRHVPSLLDLLLTDSQLLPSRVEYDSPIGRSDHTLIKASFNLKRTSITKTRPNYNKADFSEINAVLTNLVEDNMSWEHLKNAINKTVDSKVPITKCKRGNKSTLPLDSEIRELVKKKKKAWISYQTNKSEENHKRYAKLRNCLRNLTRRHYYKLEQEIATQAKTEPKRFWNYVSMKTKFKAAIPCLNMTDGTVAATDQEKAEVLSNFFSSVFTIEPEGNWEQPQQSVTTMDENIIFTESEVLKQLSQLDVTKSPGPDALHPRVLYEIRHTIANQLTSIFQHSWDTGQLPGDWKKANISAIHKKGPKCEPNNYRPVSLTAVCCKLMEKFVRIKLLDYFESNNILASQQYGFLPKRSTQLQLIKALDYWTESMDNGNDVDVIFLDFQKAFDSVPHRRLLGSLEKMGITGKPLVWIRNFLLNREQRVVLNNCKSSWKRVESGIPQGSVLGPILFLAYINSMPKVVQSKILLFADDAKIFREIQTVEDVLTLQNDLKNLEKWSNDSLLKFNRNKCVKLSLSLKNESNERNYCMGEDTILQNVTSEKDLGIHMDSRLKFEQHVTEKVKKANSMLALIRKSFQRLDIEPFNILYKSLIRSHLEYGNQVWFPQRKKERRTVENVQRRATRLVPSIRAMSYEERLRALKLPTLEYRRKRGAMIEVFKILTNRYEPETTDGLFTLNTRPSRGIHEKLNERKFKTELRRNSFTVRAAKDWNSLTNYVVQSTTLSQFKSRLDLHWDCFKYSTEWI